MQGRRSWHDGSEKRPTSRNLRPRERENTWWKLRVTTPLDIKETLRGYIVRAQPFPKWRVDKIVRAPRRYLVQGPCPPWKSDIPPTYRNKINDPQKLDYFGVNFQGCEIREKVENEVVLTAIFHRTAEIIAFESTSPCFLQHSTTT